MKLLHFPRFILMLCLAWTLAACGGGEKGDNSGAGNGNDTTASGQTGEMEGEGEESATDPDLVGTWMSDAGEILTFEEHTAEATGGASAKSGSWHVYDGMLFMFDEDAKSYSVEGDVLTIEGERFTRGGTSVEASFSIRGENVNVRAEADPGSKVLFQVSTGDAVEKVGESTFFETIGKLSDFWYKIRMDGKEGWIFGAFTSQKLSEHSRKDEMIFRGAGMGDYYHCSFDWADESSREGHGWKCERYYTNAEGNWDFGYGGNSESISGFQLSIDGESNTALEGKRFMVEWGVEMNNTWEGDGSMETIEMEVPVIHSLEQLD